MSSRCLSNSKQFCTFVRMRTLEGELEKPASSNYEFNFYLGTTLPSGLLKPCEHVLVIGPSATVVKAMLDEVHNNANFIRFKFLDATVICKEKADPVKFREHVKKSQGLLERLTTGTTVPMGETRDYSTGIAEYLRWMRNSKVVRRLTDAERKRRENEPRLKAERSRMEREERLAELERRREGKGARRERSRSPHGRSSLRGFSGHSSSPRKAADESDATLEDQRNRVVVDALVKLAEDERRREAEERAEHLLKLEEERRKMTEDVERRRKEQRKAVVEEQQRASAGAEQRRSEGLVNSGKRGGIFSDATTSLRDPYYEPLTNLTPPASQALDLTLIKPTDAIPHITEARPKATVFMPLDRVKTLAPPATAFESSKPPPRVTEINGEVEEIMKLKKSSGSYSHHGRGGQQKQGEARSAVLDKDSGKVNRYDRR